MLNLDLTFTIISSRRLPVMYAYHMTDDAPKVYESVKFFTSGFVDADALRSGQGVAHKTELG